MNRVGWSSNKDFFRNEQISRKYNNIFDIVVQGAHTLKGKYKYISDAGYGFKLISDIENNDLHKPNDRKISGINELLYILRRKIKLY